MNNFFGKKYVLLKYILFAFFVCNFYSLGHFQLYAAENKICRISFYNTKGETIFLNVEIANTEFSRRKGLMFRKHLPQNNGMLFVFEKEQILNFWMKNTFIPLSIAFIDRNGIIKEICDMTPLDETTIHSSKLLACYAVEVNKGWFSSNNIIPGCKVNFYGCIGK